MLHDNRMSSTAKGNLMRSFTMIGVKKGQYQNRESYSHDCVKYMVVETYGNNKMSIFVFWFQPQ